MESDPNEIVRVHIWVKGRVQGVAFRAHVEHFALQAGASGWVRNVGWDTVETVAEGARSKIEVFIAMTKKGPTAARVDEARVEFEPVTGEFDGFMVRRSA